MQLACFPVVYLASIWNGLVSMLLLSIWESLQLRENFTKTNKKQQHRIRIHDLLHGTQMHYPDPDLEPTHNYAFRNAHPCQGCYYLGLKEVLHELSDRVLLEFSDCCHRHITYKVVDRETSQLTPYAARITPKGKGWSIFAPY